MTTRQEILDYGMIFEGAYVDTPFGDDNWVLLRYILPSIANISNIADIISVTLRQKPSPYVSMPSGFFLD